MVWVLLALGVYLLLAGAIGTAFFRIGMRRPAPRPKNRKDLTLKGFGVSFAPYQELVRQRTAWLESRPNERVRLASFDGVELAGRLFPSDQPSKGLVIALHGYKSSGMKSFAPIAPFYLERELDLLLLDSRAHGDSRGGFIGMGVLESRDLLAWVDWAIRRRGEGTPIYLHGMSMGAAATLMAASRLPSQVKGLIGDSGFSTSLGMARLRARVMMPGWMWNLFGPVSLWWVKKLCRWKAGYRLEEGAAPASLAQSHIPILLIHGEKDQVVPLSMCLENREACAAPCRLLVIPGCGHVQAYLKDPQAYEEAVEALLGQTLGAFWGAAPNPAAF